MRSERLIVPTTELPPHNVIAGMRQNKDNLASYLAKSAPKNKVELSGYLDALYALRGQFLPPASERSISILNLERAITLAIQQIEGGGQVPEKKPPPEPFTSSIPPYTQSPPSKPGKVQIDV